MGEVWYGYTGGMKILYLFKTNSRDTGMVTETCHYNKDSLEALMRFDSAESRAIDKAFEITPCPIGRFVCAGLTYLAGPERSQISSRAASPTFLAPLPPKSASASAKKSLPARFDLGLLGRRRRLLS